MIGVGFRLDLIRLDTRLIIDYVTSALKDFPGITGVYLFGSSLDVCRPDSDIDIGVFVSAGLNERQTACLEGAMALKLTPFEGHPFDLTLINIDNTILAFRILKEGLPVVIRDQEKFTDIMEKVSRDYSEKGFRYQQAISEILKEVELNGYRS